MATTAARPGFNRAGDLTNPGYAAFIIVVTVLSIVNWVILILPVDLGSNGRGLLVFMEPILTAILLTDFFMRLHRARPDRWGYMNRGGGWLDLVGSLPYGRILRLFRLVRVVMAFRTYGTRNTLRWFVTNRAQGTLFLVLAILTVLLEVGGLVVLHFEAGAPGANIETGGEALWWGVVTISTVGYGDYYPVTAGGQVTATIMIFSGVALIGIYTAWAASSFLGKGSGSTPLAGDQGTASTAPGDDVEGVIAELRAQLDRLEAMVARGPGRS